MEQHDISDHEIESAITEMTQARYPKSCCPSEIARLKFPENWREKMDLVRAISRKLASEGSIEITQKEKPLNPASEFRGPIRLKAKRR